jgi:hypothetical protein
MSDQPHEMPPYFGAPGFAESYWIELLYDKSPSPDIDALVSTVSAQMPIEVNFKVITGNEGTASVGYPDRLINVGDAKLPAMTNLAWNGGHRINLGDYKAALDQTWDWDGARKALGRCWYKLILGDITCSRLPYAERLRRLTTLATACVDQTQPRVVFWKEAGCLVEPKRLAERMGRSCNVREFNVGIAGDKLMDTLGLAAIGLPDLEVVFSKLDPDRVADFLYKTAAYLFERGDIINDGDTVPGPEGARWKTAHDVARVAPSRTVVRVMATGPYAPVSPFG